jgi:serine/threonine-protein kinase RsbW
MPTRKYSGHYQHLSEISELISQIARDAGFGSEQVYGVRLAVVEACTNIIEHGYGGEGRGDFVLTYSSDEDGIKITIQDWGKCFEPEAVADPNYDVPLDELQFRGAGLFLMRKLMDDVDYQFSDSNGNLLTMVKRK